MRVTLAIRRSRLLLLGLSQMHLRKPLAILAAFVLPALCGCMEVKQSLKVHPDGSADVATEFRVRARWVGLIGPALEESIRRNHPELQYFVRQEVETGDEIVTAKGRVPDVSRLSGQEATYTLRREPLGASSQQRMVLSIQTPVRARKPGDLPVDEFFSYRVQVTMPGAIEATNGGRLNDTTVRWWKSGATPGLVMTVSAIAPAHGGGAYGSTADSATSFRVGDATPYCDTSPPPGPAVLITWPAVAGATGYQVYRDGRPVGGATLPAETEFRNNLDVRAGAAYKYQVGAFGPRGRELRSESRSVAVPANICGTGRIDEALREVVLNPAAKRPDRLRAVLPLAEIAAAVYAQKGTGGWEVVEAWTNAATGFRAALYRNSGGGELVMAFAGTEPGNLGEKLQRQRKRLIADLCFKGVSPLAFCSRVAGYASAEAGSAVVAELMLEELAELDAKSILDDPVRWGHLRQIVKLVMGEADTNTDINLAFPKLASSESAGAFGEALDWYARWSEKAQKGAYSGGAGAEQIVAITGHSLGGSLAQAVGLRFGVPVVTFNSAPLPLDPDFRRAIGFSEAKVAAAHIVNLRAMDDPLTSSVLKIGADARVRVFMVELIEGLFIKLGNPLGQTLKARYEHMVNRNWFYCGQWIEAPSQSGHGIGGLVQYLANLKARSGR